MLDKLKMNLVSKKLWVLFGWAIIFAVDREIASGLALPVMTYLLGQSYVDAGGLGGAVSPRTIDPSTGMTQ